MQELDAAAVKGLLEGQGYIAEAEVVTAVFLAHALQKPLLIEGPAGVGKTEIAKAMASALDTELIRLQCYEGLDASTALYEWNYQRQLLHLKMMEGRADAGDGKSLAEKEEAIFGEDFLLKRPLLRAITHHRRPVLLIDELDRADEEFESFLLEILAEWQISIPELGPVKAEHVPYVVLTSNRTRELSEAVRRRCLYLWIDYPEFAKEVAIVHRRVPGASAELAEQVCRFMETVRQAGFDKAPGVAETLDWARALVALHRDRLDPEVVEQTLGIVFKDRGDIEQARESLAEFLERVGVRTRLADPNPHGD